MVRAGLGDATLTNGTIAKMYWSSTFTVLCEKSQTRPIVPNTGGDCDVVQSNLLESDIHDSDKPKSM